MPAVEDYSETLVFENEQEKKDSAEMAHLEWTMMVKAIQEYKIELAEIAVSYTHLTLPTKRIV